MGEQSCHVSTRPVLLGSLRHPRDAGGTDEAAVVIQIRLHHVHDLVIDHPLELPQLEFCSPNATSFLVRRPPSCSLNSSQGHGSSNHRYFISWKRLPTRWLFGIVGAVGIGHERDLAGEFLMRQFEDLSVRPGMASWLSLMRPPILNFTALAPVRFNAADVDIDFRIGSQFARGTG